MGYEVIMTIVYISKCVSHPLMWEGGIKPIFSIPIFRKNENLAYL